MAEELAAIILPPARTIAAPAPMIKEVSRTIGALARMIQTLIPTDIPAVKAYAALACKGAATVFDAKKHVWMIGECARTIGERA